MRISPLPSPKEAGQRGSWSHVDTNIKDSNKSERENLERGIYFER